MQYILTEDEYKALKSQVKAVHMQEKDRVQKLCTLVANFKPVPRAWLGDDAEPKPWGCIRNTVNNPGYCDDCPVDELCPYEHKEFSQ